MAGSDDEAELFLPKVVSDYTFLDDNREPISFSELPLIWGSDDSERLEGSIKEIGLIGTTDNGLQKVFEQVVAWKFDCSSAKPEIYVLAKKKKYWIKLSIPRKAFEMEVRTILVTVRCLHFLKRNPRTSGKDLWDHLAKVFRLFDPKPSLNDIVDHLKLVEGVVKRDESLARSKLLVNFLRKKPQKNYFTGEEGGTKNMSKFVVPDHVTDEEGEGSSEKEEGEDGFEDVCAICDNGGKLVCCDGKCRRAFHATKKAGLDSSCESLGFSKEQVKALASFKCKNCKYMQHQCYICGELGSSDKSTGTKVFQCRAETCGHFYHPHCVAKAIRIEYGDRSKDLEEKIAAGEPFMCPLHVCHGCKKREAKNNDLRMQFAVCRRCPRAYHRKCLPRKIAFEDDEDNNIVQRAWEDLLPNKILIYCLKHEIDEKLQTAIRNHIKFPDTHQKKKKQDLGSVGREKCVPKRSAEHEIDEKLQTAIGNHIKFPDTHQKKKKQDLGSVGREKCVPNRSAEAAEDAAGKKAVAKQAQRNDILFARKWADDSSTRKDRLSMPELLKKPTMENNSEVAKSGLKNKTSLETQQNEPSRKVVAEQSQGTDKLLARKRSADASTREDRLSMPEHLKKPKVENNVKVANSCAENKTFLENQQKEPASSKKFVAKQSDGTDRLLARKRAADASTKGDRLSMAGHSKKRRLKNNRKIAISTVDRKTSLENQQQNETVPRAEITDPNQQREMGKPAEDEVNDDLTVLDDPNQQKETGKPVGDEVEDDPAVLDADSKNRILSILKEAESTIKLEHVVPKYEVPFSSKCCMQNVKLGEKEGGVEAHRPSIVLLDSLGFATGPYCPSSQQNTSGWIYE